MQEVGQQLKQIRLEKGISLEDIEAATKVRARYLKAIEDGNLDILPGQIYAMGFIRSYVRYLGLNEEEITGYYKDYYKKLNNQMEEIPEVQHRHQSSGRARTISNAIPPRPIETRQKAFGGRFIWLVLVLIILGAAVALYAIGTEENGNNVSGSPQVNGNSAGTNVKPTTPDTSSNPGTSDSPVTPTTPTTPDVNQEPVFDGINVKVTISGGSCWLGITSDGNYTEETLKDGDVREYKAEKTLSIRYGNAGVVKTECSGDIVNPVGNKGEVKTVKYAK